MASCPVGHATALSRDPRGAPRITSNHGRGRGGQHRRPHSHARSAVAPHQQSPPPWWPSLWASSQYQSPPAWRQALHRYTARVALAPPTVVTMVWRWSCRRTLRRQAPQAATAQPLYATWQTRGALIGYMPPGRCVAPRLCATVALSEHDVLAPWMLGTAAIARGLTSAPRVPRPAARGRGIGRKRHGQ
jgi:hypothetical protein